MRIKEMFRARDMTEGKPWKNLLAFAVPMIIGNVAQQMYSVVDAIVVGHFLGDDALGAIGATMAIYMMLLVLFIGISSGAGIMVSQYFGAKRREDLSYTICISITITLLAGILVMALAPLGTRPLLTLLNLPEAMLDLSVQYINILLWGCLGIASYNILAGILRGLGDSFSPFVYLVISSIISAGLNVLFVGVFGWGIAGAAVSTVMSQLLSGVLCFIRLMKMTDVFDMSRKFFAPIKKYVLQVVRLGLPTGASQAVFSVAMLMIAALINDFGEALVTSHTIVMKIDGFVIMPIFSFGNAIMAYAGQNVGAGKLERVKQGTRQCAIMSLVFSVFVTAGIIFFGRYLAGLFTSTDYIMDLSVRILRILAPGYIALAFGQMYWGVLRGAGDVMTPMWVTFVTTIAIRVPSAYLFVHIMRSMDHVSPYEGIFYSALLAWTLGSFAAYFFYRRGEWRTKGIVRS